jgi:hypothetical protein
MKQTEQSERSDLILNQIEKSNELPFLLLGLDGWLIRSVPKELRRQFLEGYGRLLKIAFHPDRYEDSNKKESRTRYLQTVGEAIRLMLTDEIAFEVSAECIPTRRNPLVEFQNRIDILNKIVSKRDNLIAEIDARARDAQAQVDDLQAQNQNLRDAEDRESRRNFKIKQNLKFQFNQFPAPLSIERCVVNGFFIEMSNQSNAIETISKWDLRNIPTDAIQRTTSIVNVSGLKKTTLELRSGNVKCAEESRLKNFRAQGAFSIIDLIHFKTDGILESLVPFFSVNMFLFLSGNNTETDATETRYFLVTEIPERDLLERSFNKLKSEQLAKIGKLYESLRKKSRLKQIQCCELSSEKRKNRENKILVRKLRIRIKGFKEKLNSVRMVDARARDCASK